MHTTQEQYKGFTISYRRQSPARGGAAKYFVEAKGFNPEGYATINTAKGAITKALNATGYSDVSKAKAALAATGDDKERTSVPAQSVQRSRAKRDGTYGGFHDGRHSHTRWGRLQSLSSGTSDYYWPNRKARKAVLIAASNMGSGKQYGGKIINRK